MARKKNPRGRDLYPGESLYSITTGRSIPWKSTGKASPKTMMEMEGYVATYEETPGGRLLWLYETRELAEENLRLAIKNGLICGDGVHHYIVGIDRRPFLADGEPEEKPVIWRGGAPSCTRTPRDR